MNYKNLKKYELINILKQRDRELGEILYKDKIEALSEHFNIKMSDIVPENREGTVYTVGVSHLFIKVELLSTEDLVEITDDPVMQDSIMYELPDEFDGRRRIGSYEDNTLAFYFRWL